MSRLELEGMLHRLRAERFELTTRADAKIKGIKALLNMSAITPVDEIDIEGVHALAAELLAVKQQMLENLGKAKKIEKEING
ncbi:MAG: hypothetical protein M0024_01395 [Nitrospiraceae bacterium]|nr:hypothetical protein [Nitrospiraceae bacterium]